MNTFKEFLNKLKTPDNSQLIESISLGYDIICESVSFSDLDEYIDEVGEYTSNRKQVKKYIEMTGQAIFLNGNDYVPVDVKESNGDEFKVKGEIIKLGDEDVDVINVSKLYAPKKEYWDYI